MGSWQGLGADLTVDWIPETQPRIVVQLLQNCSQQRMQREPQLKRGSEKILDIIGRHVEEPLVGDSLENQNI